LASMIYSRLGRTLLPAVRTYILIIDKAIVMNISELINIIGNI